MWIANANSVDLDQPADLDPHYLSVLQNLAVN